MRIKIFLIVFLISSCVDTSLVNAEERRITIAGRSEITVTTSNLKLSDVADIQSSSQQDDEAVIGLKKILLGVSPKPGQVLILAAYDIIQKLKEQGVSTNTLNYTFPKNISVRRAGRALTKEELEPVISSYIKKENSSAELKQVILSSNTMVSPGDLNISVESSNLMTGGRRAFDLVIVDNDHFKQSLTIPAIVAEYREVPVAKHQLSKGSILSDDDVVMARLSIESIPQDTVSQTSDILGYEAHSEIKSGEILRLQKFAPPILIQSGSSVTMKFQSALFEATASGIALESGGMGQEIKVKNDTSKKIISGRVIETGVVKVQ